MRITNEYERNCNHRNKCAAGHEAQCDETEFSEPDCRTWHIKTAHVGFKLRKPFQQVVICGNDKTRTCQHDGIARDALVFAQCSNKSDNRQRIHCDALIPTQLAWGISNVFAEIQAAHHRPRGHRTHHPESRRTNASEPTRRPRGLSLRCNSHQGGHTPQEGRNCQQCAK